MTDTQNIIHNKINLEYVVEENIKEYKLATSS